MATVFLLFGIAEVARAVQVELSADAPPLIHGLRFGVGIVICLTVGGVLAWRAVRAYRS